MTHNPAKFRFPTLENQSENPRKALAVDETSSYNQNIHQKNEKRIQISSTQHYAWYVLIVESEIFNRGE